MSALGSLTVFVGSSSGSSPAYATAAHALGTHLGRVGTTLVYGGAQVGLMGVVADAALAAGGEVVGVIPRSLVDREIAHDGLTELHVVSSMHERKQLMADLGDAFVALPGGVGTLEELVEVWTWQHLGLHAKPVALLDVDGYWQPLLALVDRMVSAGFLSAETQCALVVAHDPEQLLGLLQDASAPPTRWD